MKAFVILFFMNFVHRCLFLYLNLFCDVPVHLNALLTFFIKDLEEVMDLRIGSWCFHYRIDVGHLLLHGRCRCIILFSRAICRFILRLSRLIAISIDSWLTGTLFSLSLFI